MSVDKPDEEVARTEAFRTKIENLLVQLGGHKETLLSYATLTAATPRPLPWTPTVRGMILN